MATKKEYLEYVLEQFSEVSEITFRAMMGEYLLYYDGKLFGGIYDDRLLVKETPAAKRILADAPTELPYEGAKPMLLVTEMEDKALLKELVQAMWEELPTPKKKK